MVKWFIACAVMCSTLLLGIDQCLYDFTPFLVQRAGSRRLSRLLIPIARVGSVAFLAVEIGMHPVAAGIALVLLCMLVGFLPVALGVPPQGLERQVKFGGRFGMRDRRLEAGQVHVGTSSAS